MPRCLGPSHPDTNARCAAMTIRPYKPRDSARSALLTAVRLCLLRGEEKSEDQPRRGLYSKASQPAFYSKAASLL